MLRAAWQRTRARAINHHTAVINSCGPHGVSRAGLRFRVTQQRRPTATPRRNPTPLDAMRSARERLAAELTAVERGADPAELLRSVESLCRMEETKKEEFIRICERALQILLSAINSSAVPGHKTTQTFELTMKLIPRLMFRVGITTSTVAQHGMRVLHAITNLMCDRVIAHKEEAHPTIHTSNKAIELMIELVDHYSQKAHFDNELLHHVGTVISNLCLLTNTWQHPRKRWSQLRVPLMKALMRIEGGKSGADARASLGSGLGFILKDCQDTLDTSTDWFEELLGDVPGGVQHVVEGMWNNNIPMDAVTSLGFSSVMFFTVGRNHKPNKYTKPKIELCRDFAHLDFWPTIVRLMKDDDRELCLAGVGLLGEVSKIVEEWELSHDKAKVVKKALLDTKERFKDQPAELGIVNEVLRIFDEKGWATATRH